jgi:hypothetical protein
MIVEKYPNRPVAARSRENLSKIKENREKASEFTATKPAKK